MRSLRAAFAASLLVSLPAGILACVGDAPTATSIPDSGAIPDASTNDGTAPADGASPTDAGAEACSTATVGNTVKLPNGATGFVTLKSSGPIVAGDYLLTGVYFSCLQCTTYPSAAVGGLRIGVSGQTVTIERNLTLQAGGAQQVLVDRWTGTFDQIKVRLNVSQDCPTPGTSASWLSIFPYTDAGPTKTLEVQFTDTPVPLSSSDGGLPPYFVFTRQ